MCGGAAEAAAHHLCEWVLFFFFVSLRGMRDVSVWGEPLLLILVGYWLLAWRFFLLISAPVWSGPRRTPYGTSVRVRENSVDVVLFFLYAPSREDGPVGGTSDLFVAS